MSVDGLTANSRVDGDSMGIPWREGGEAMEWKVGCPAGLRNGTELADERSE